MQWAFKSTETNSRHLFIILLPLPRTADCCTFSEITQKWIDLNLTKCWPDPNYRGILTTDHWTFLSSEDHRCGLGALIKKRTQLCHVTLFCPVGKQSACFCWTTSIKERQLRSMPWFSNWDNSFQSAASINNPFYWGSLYKTSNKHWQTKSMEVFQLFGVLFWCVTHNIWENELFWGGLRLCFELLRCVSSYYYYYCCYCLK